jgi:hypothetical protein
MRQLRREAARLCQPDPTLGAAGDQQALEEDIDLTSAGQ